MKLLHIDSSVLGENSISRQLTAEVVAQWRQRHAATEVDYLDLAVSAPNHLNADALGFRIPPSGELSEAQRRENAVSERLVRQFLSADVVVLGAPLYNFTIPSQLKAWLDRVAQAGRTFKYTEQGAVGLAGGKTVIAVLSRGGLYSTSEAGRATEHQESYLKVMFGFFGITDLRVVRAEGIALGEAPRAAALRAARAAIPAVTQAEAAAEELAALAA